MSTPKYIINWEELLDILEGRFQVDINDIDLEIGKLFRWADREDYRFTKSNIRAIKGQRNSKGAFNIIPRPSSNSRLQAPYKIQWRCMITGITYLNQLGNIKTVGV